MKENRARWALFLGYRKLCATAGLADEDAFLNNKLIQHGVSLVAQWLRICLPMQGTRVRALVWEDPTCRGATKPVRHNY